MVEGDLERHEGGRDFLERRRSGSRGRGPCTRCGTQQDPDQFIRVQGPPICKTCRG
jgi:hypothetical protein